MRSGRPARLGVGCELWHSEPAPAFPIFQNREGFGGQFPWTQPPAGRDITYDVADFPEATALLDSSLVICDMKHPIFVQPMEVIEAYAATIREVPGGSRADHGDGGVADPGLRSCLGGSCHRVSPGLRSLRRCA